MTKLAVPGAVLALAAVCFLGRSGEPPAGVAVSPEPVSAGWLSLGPDERSRALRNYCEFQALPADEQRKIESRYRRWQGLTDDERERARRRWQASRPAPGSPAPGLPGESVPVSALR